MAQEKLGKTKTHQEVVDLMNQMATDPKKGITFRDFVVVQLLSKGIKIENNIGGNEGVSSIRANIRVIPVIFLLPFQLL